MPQTLPSVPSLLNRIRSLSHRPPRDAQQRYFIEGLRPLIQAHNARLHIDTLITCPQLLTNTIARKLAHSLESRGIPHVRLSPQDFRPLAVAPQPSGIGAILRQHWTPLHRPLPHPGSCWLVLHSIRSPGNLGTILRTAEAAGIAGILLLGHDIDPFDPAVVRASMGGLFHLRLTRLSPDELSTWCTHHQVELLGLSPRASQLYTNIPTRRPIALLLGEERRGIPADLSARCHRLLRLPMSGTADSLNVAITAGIMIYEWRRRRAEHA